MSETPARSATLRFVWSPTEAPSLPEEPSELLRGRKIAIVGGDPEVAAGVEKTLKEAGAIPYQFASQQTGSSDMARPFGREALRSDGIIHLNLAQDFSMESANAWEQPM